MKFLFVGLGGIGQRHLRNLRTLRGDSVQVSAWRTRKDPRVLSETLEVQAADGLEARYGVRPFATLEAALADRPDAVFVCNPSSLHMDVALAAARAGCHLFLEKPLADELGRVDELCAVLAKEGRHGLVGYQMRWHPCLRRLQEIIRGREIGVPLAGRIQVGDYMPGWHRYEDYRELYASKAALGGGVILSQIHEIDYAWWLFGEPRRVVTMGGHLSALEIDVEDVASTLLEFRVEGRALPVHLHQDFLQRPSARTCEVVGSAGRVHVDLIAGTLRRFDEAGVEAEAMVLEGFTRNDLFLDELRHFLACVEGRATPQISVRDGAASVRIALAARESLRLGRLVDLA